MWLSTLLGYLVFPLENKDPDVYQPNRRSHNISTFQWYFQVSQTMKTLFCMTLCLTFPKLILTELVAV